MKAVVECPGDSIAIIGYSQSTIFKNVISLLLNSPELNYFADYCTYGKRDNRAQLHFAGKTIFCIGAADEGSAKAIQGLTLDLCYCDEMTLYPDVVIDMIKTRLSRDHSQLFASMNPSHPAHKLKMWIDLAEGGDSNYYSLHFTLDDNPFVSQSYKEDLRKTLSGVFYKRNYLGLWCLAEGSIFDFFDKDLHVVARPPRAAEYWLAGIDYGTINPFVCLLIGVSTGKYENGGHRWWIEKEYYWDPKVKGRQKTNSEFADDVQKFLDPYYIRGIYIDPSAAAFKEELRRRKMKPIDANNDVEQGIQTLSRELSNGNLVILQECINTIREAEGYVWNSKKNEIGKEEPLKKNDHSVDAARYVVHTHRITKDFAADDSSIGGFRRMF
jgi:PBSX family phage terminase large subunit